jgi:hypothetical protein
MSGEIIKLDRLRAERLPGLLSGSSIADLIDAAERIWIGDTLVKDNGEWLADKIAAPAEWMLPAKADNHA